MKNSKEIIDAEIAYWVNRDKSYQSFFQAKVIKGVFRYCDVVTQSLDNRDVLIKRFIEGMVLTKQYIDTNDDDLREPIDKLTKPVIDLIKTAVTTDEYRKHIIDLEITGTDILNCGGGITSVVTKEEILRHIKRKNIFPIMPSDIAAILPDYKDYKMKQYGGNASKQMENESKRSKPEQKPIFKKEAVNEIYDLLKDFFSEIDQSQLKPLIETGDDAKEYLIFLENGNRLADAFKQLKEADLITGCSKKVLEAWILKNFRYSSQGEIKSFSVHYINDLISSNKDLCQNPILNVKLDKDTGKYKITKA